MTEPAPVPVAEPVPEIAVFTEPITVHEVVPEVPADDRPHRDDTKDEWVAWAIGRGMPSYEAWALTKPALMKETTDA